ncbi:plasmid segregation protein ParM domain-containing protein, partial [Escherichia coli]|uniref:plasmid segregation protein ParM domain-containing protein n=1 Tax=Escherichia coli TaxID=562 RepID=UPI002023AB02
MLKVSCDDGSTNVKLAWLEDGEVRTSLSGNSFKEGWNPGLFNAGKVYNYVVDGKKYTYDLGSTAVIGTTHVSYQYSTTNLLAIHHALLTSGLQPQDVELTVTLPVTEFFDNDNQPNEERIERKKANVLREISPVSYQHLMQPTKALGLVSGGLLHLKKQQSTGSKVAAL